MTNAMPTPHEEGQVAANDELKKLRKREQRALERLQEAQKAQSRALERFQRAEARLQKRSARVQRVEGCLALLRQQLEQVPGREQPPPIAYTQHNTDLYRGGAGGSAPALVNHARAAAEAAEENARLAAERASEIAARAADEAELLAADAEQLLDEVVETSQESPATPEEIASIEEDEELISALTAETIAHITAERAAKAEVIAEISSKQTLEARRQAQEAEQSLAELRAAVRAGVLNGEEAQEALWRAEHAVTRAQAFLADAEANEEQAVNAAMNAEADAEVAEGMAFAAVDHVTLLATANEQERAPEDDDDAEDITTKISIVRVQEQL